MSRDHLLGFPPILLALDEPVRASQITPLRPMPIMGKADALHLDKRITRELDKPAQTPAPESKPEKPAGAPFQVGDWVLYISHEDSAEVRTVGQILRVYHEQGEWQNDIQWWSRYPSSRNIGIQHQSLPYLKPWTTRPANHVAP